MERYTDAAAALLEEELKACETDLKHAQGELRDYQERCELLTKTVEEQGATIGRLQREISELSVALATAEAEGLVYLTGPGNHSLEDEWARETPVEPMPAVTEKL
jgi:chromosome segregation ATPase